MIVVPNNGVTTTQRPLLKITLDVPLPIGAELRVLRGETVLGTATLAVDQQGEPGRHYEFRHAGISAGTYQYSAAVVNGGNTTTSPLYTIEVVPLVLPTVTGVYEQETINSGLFMFCPVFENGSSLYPQYHDFGFRVVITPDEPSGTYTFTTDADASEELRNLGFEVEHLTGNLTIVERMGSELHDWWDKVVQFEHNPQGSRWTMHWPEPSELESQAEVPYCSSGV